MLNMFASFRLVRGEREPATLRPLSLFNDNLTMTLYMCVHMCYTVCAYGDLALSLNEMFHFAMRLYLGIKPSCMCFCFSHTGQHRLAR